MSADRDAACTCGQRHTTWTNDKDVSNEGHSVACPANPQFAKPSAAYRQELSDEQRTVKVRPSLTEADAHAKETVRLWKAGEQTNPWPEQDANLAAAFIAVRKEQRELRREITYWRSLTPVSLGGERV